MECVYCVVRTGYLRLTWLMACVQTPRQGFEPSSAQVRFVVDYVAVEQVFPLTLQFLSFRIIPSMLHNRLFHTLFLSEGQEGEN